MIFSKKLVENATLLEMRGRNTGMVNFDGTEITNRMREIIIQWMCNVYCAFKLKPQTYFLSVCIFDTCINKSNIKKSKLQLYALTSIFLAGKKLEILRQDIDNYVHLSDGGYDKYDMIKCEKKIFCILQGDLNFPCPHFYLGLLLGEDFYDKFRKGDGKNRDILRIGTLLLQASTLSPSYSTITTTLLASGAYYILCKMENTVPNNLFKINEKDIKSSEQFLLAIFRKFKQFRKKIDGGFYMIKKYDIEELNKIPLPETYDFTIFNEENVSETYLPNYVPLNFFNRQIFRKIKTLGFGVYGKVLQFADTKGDNFAYKKYFNEDNDGISASYIKELSALILMKNSKYVIDVKSYGLYGLAVELMNLDMKTFLIKQTTILPPELQKTYTSQLIKGLSYIHENGIIHGDIKPENILISYDTNNQNKPTLKIIDFGVSVFMYPGIIHSEKTKLCTIPYRPPDLILGNLEFDEKIDVWALACTLYEILEKSILFNLKDDKNTDDDLQTLEIKILHRIFSTFGLPNKKDFDGLLLHEKTFRKISQIYSEWDLTDAKGLKFNDNPNVDITMKEIISKMLIFDPRERPQMSDILYSYSHYLIK